jgi:uncharacterized membrane protein (UPF0127 family)
MEMNKKISLNFGKNKILIEAHVVRGFERFSGLMFSRKEKAKILLFEFRKPVRLAIHSLFVFFSFIAIWTDEHGKIIEIKKVKPFSLTVCPEKNFSSFVEIPLSKKYKDVVDDIEKFK